MAGWFGKNVLSAFQQCFVLLAVVPIQWIVFGYSLSFGPDVFAGLCGGWQWIRAAWRRARTKC